MSIHSEKNYSVVIPPGNAEFNISWNQAFAEGDLIKGDESRLIIRPRYEFKATIGGEPLFSHTSIFVLLFGVQNREAVDKALESAAVKKLFFEKQIMKTMWPILRQQILDGMSRLGLPAMPLPWIVE
ncbi:MAG: hypothetical protein ACLQMF_05140 [Rectinemataceae bacterium]